MFYSVRTLYPFLCMCFFFFLFLREREHQWFQFIQFTLMFSMSHASNIIYRLLSIHASILSCLLGTLRPNYDFEEKEESRFMMSCKCHAICQNYTILLEKMFLLENYAASNFLEFCYFVNEKTWDVLEFIRNLCMKAIIALFSSKLILICFFR